MTDMTRVASADDEARASTASAPIWTPGARRVAEANLTAFIARANQLYQLKISDYAGLHRFSVDEPARFWSLLADFCNVKFDHRGERTLINGNSMLEAKWFPDARLNIARTLLAPDSALPAIVCLREDGVRREWNFGQLREMVSRMSQAMRGAGVQVGDCVASMTPSIPETVAAMLATAAIGAVWASCSPEYGVAAAVDRIGQICPKLIFLSDAYMYGGKLHDLLEKSQEILALVPSIRTAVVVPEFDASAGIHSGISLEEFLAPFEAKEIEYESLPFDQPAYVLFSSGTTGAPKCIVHGAGGPLLENLKAHTLQFDVKVGDRIYMPCTTGWMVWNVMTMALGCGACIVLYDGSAFYPTRDALVAHTAQEKATLARWAARYVDAIAKAGHVPKDEHDLGALKSIMCNGSPFDANGYEYIYTKAKADVHLISPSGGTDSFGSLVSNSPISPVWAGEIQHAALGFDLDIFDADGNSTRGAPGEMVVKKPFPSMPLYYLDDPDRVRYRESYYGLYPNVWRHGDWAEITRHGGIVIHGRSDATLNAKGVRIGTSEIYRQLTNVPEIVDSVVVAQEWDGDTRVVMFVQLQPKQVLDDGLEQKIRNCLRDNLSPRHVPSKILAVQGIPVTLTGKVSEAAVREAIHNRPVKNVNALANPGTLAYFSPERHAQLAAS